MSVTFRKQVLNNFKMIHRTRQHVFRGDQRALEAARQKINEEFNKHKHIQDEESIKALVQLGEEVERELRTQVIQAHQVEPGVFEARITEHTLKVENIPYNDTAVSYDEQKGAACCQNQTKNVK